MNRKPWTPPDPKFYPPRAALYHACVSASASEMIFTEGLAWAQPAFDHYDATIRKADEHDGSADSGDMTDGVPRVFVSGEGWMPLAHACSYYRRGVPGFDLEQEMSRLRAKVEREIVAALRDDGWRGVPMDLPSFDRLAAKILAGDYPRETEMA